MNKLLYAKFVHHKVQHCVYRSLQNKTRWIQWAAFAIWAFAVSASVDRWVTRFDAHSRILPHACVYDALTFCGQLMALSMATWTRSVTMYILSLFFPGQSEERSREFSKSLSTLFITISMFATLFWTSPILNLFIDQHKGLYVEVDLCLLLMGFINGVSWNILLNRHTWIGLIFTSVGILMMLSNTLARSSW